MLNYNFELFRNKKNIIEKKELRLLNESKIFQLRKIFPTIFIKISIDSTKASIKTK